jgi:ADP-heptose:LPS heptosyltransferase
MLKNIDRLAGGILVSLWPPLSAPAATPVAPASLLIIRPGGIGDAVLLAPAIAQVRKSFPSIFIDILAESRNAGAFPLVPGIRSVYRYDHPREFLAVLRRRYDVVIDTEQWHRLSALFARVVRAPVKIGFATNERRRMFTHPVPYSHDDYEADSFCRLFAPLGIDAPPDLGGAFLTIPAEAATSGNRLIAPLERCPFVVLFPGASIAERRWGTARFREVAQGLVSGGYAVVVVGGEADAVEGEAIVRDLRGLNLAGRTSLAESAAILHLSRLLISGDSGVLHLAVGVGTPTVSLFGPGRGRKWAPRGPHHTVINKGFPCSPCTTFGTTPPCPDCAACMAAITVQDISSAVSRCLEENKWPGLPPSGNKFC